MKNEIIINNKWNINIIINIDIIFKYWYFMYYLLFFVIDIIKYS